MKQIIRTICKKKIISSYSRERERAKHSRKFLINDNRNYAFDGKYLLTCSRTSIIGIDSLSLIEIVLPTVLTKYFRYTSNIVAYDFYKFYRSTAIALRVLPSSYGSVKITFSITKKPKFKKMISSVFIVCACLAANAMTMVRMIYSN